MQALTNAPEEQADDFVRNGLVPYLAQFVITINSVTDVLPPPEKGTFLILEGEHFMSHTQPNELANHSGDSLQFFAVFGRGRDNESLEEDTVRNGRAVEDFEECLATIAIREHAAEDKVRDYGTLDLVQFVYGKHSVTDKIVDLKLGGTISTSIECVIERWQDEFDVMSSQVVRQEPVYEVIERHVTKREYGDIYKTRWCHGEWTEYPLVSEVETPAQFRFWSIEGPEECDSEGDDELEQVCEAKYRVARTRRQRGCKVGQVAKPGKLSVLQKYRVMAIEPLTANVSEPCSLESLKEGNFWKGVSSSEVEFVQVCDEDDERDDKDGEERQVGSRRTSVCSDG